MRTRAPFSKRSPWSKELTGKPQKYTYVDENRIGDHICYYSDLTKMKSHYPGLADHPIVKRNFQRDCGVVGETACRIRYSYGGRGMKILITGICGFAGSHLAMALAERIKNARIVGIDNLLRPGSESDGPAALK